MRPVIVCGKSLGFIVSIFFVLSFFSCGDDSIITLQPPPDDGEETVYSWKPMDGGQYFYGVWGSAEGTIFAGGSEGRIFRYGP